MNRLLTAVAVALVVAGTPGQALAWNKPGHMATGAIAYKVLKAESPETLEKVLDLLKQHPYYETHWEPQIMRPFVPAADRDLYLFMLAARWADDARPDPDFYPDGLHLDRQHYINLPFRAAGEPENVKLLPSDADVNIFRGYATNLKKLSQDLSLADRAVALTWVCHLVGDVHQPLHTSAMFSTKFPKGDQGGTIFFIRPRADGGIIHLHHFWDELILSSNRFDDVKKRSTELFLRPEFKRGKLTELTETDFEKWGNESFKLAQEVVYVFKGDPLKGSPKRNEAGTLPDGYSTAAQAVAERRAVLAGYRLAAVLKKTFE